MQQETLLSPDDQPGPLAAESRKRKANLSPYIQFGFPSNKLGWGRSNSKDKLDANQEKKNKLFGFLYRDDLPTQCSKCAVPLIPDANYCVSCGTNVWDHCTIQRYECKECESSFATAVKDVVYCAGCGVRATKASEQRRVVLRPLYRPEQ